MIDQFDLSRRQFLRLVGGAAGSLAVLPLLAACGDDDDDGNDSGSGGPAETAPTTASDPAPATPEATEASSEPSATDEPVAESSPEDPATTAASERPVLRVGVQGLPTGLDPDLELSNVGTRVTYSIFDHLLERDFLNGNPPGTGSEVLPMLAESWEREDDLTLLMKLRPGVLFHNGDLLTAEDVKFTFERLLNDPVEDLVDAQGYVSTIVEIEAVDDLTVRFTTAKPDPLLEIRLTSWASWILPQAYYEAVGMEGFAQEPVGTGPYKFVELRPDDILILDSHDDWWGGLPPVARIEFRVIPEIAARVAALASGEVDIVTNIPPDQVAAIESSDGVEVRSVPLANCHVLRYNTNNAALENKLIRQALNLAIDRELLVETLWSGSAVLTRGHQFEEYSGPIGGDQFNEERPYIPYDPDRARELLAEAGYDGEAIEFRSAPGYYTYGAEAAQAIVQMWQDIGINASVSIRENPYDEGVEAIQVTNWSNSSFVADPDGAFWLRWGEPTASQRDFWTPQSPRFNELGNAARETLDSTTRYEAYQEMLDIWDDEAPGTVLYIPIENYGVRSDIEWTPYSFYFMDLRPKVLKISES